MIKLDMSLFVQIVNFIFLILVLNSVLYKPIRKILLQRKEKFNKLGQNIDTFDKDAQERDDSYLSGIKAARLKGVQEKETLLQSASSEERAIVDKINATAQKDLETVREKIAKDTEAVKVLLQQEIDVFAEAIKEKILGRAVS